MATMIEGPMETPMEIDSPKPKGKLETPKSSRKQTKTKTEKTKTLKTPNSERKRVQKKKKRKITKTKKVTKTTKIVKRTTIRRRILTGENKFKMKEKKFIAWKDDDFVIDVLQRRGWTYLGEPVEDGREDYPNSLYEAKENGLIKDTECLYWADDDDSKVLKGFSSQHLISSIPNADKSLTKVYQQKMFEDYSWFPKCFTLPKQTNLLLEFLKLHPESYWIAKPRDSYGGFGMCVYKANSEEFKHVLDRKCTFALQRYMENPYLYGGLYKFHLRCYMIITNIQDPFRAYLWKNAQVQFSTHTFDLTQIEKNFNKYSHITNYKVNNEKKNNARVIADKPGVGPGTEWGVQRFIDEMTKNEPKFNEDKFWGKLTEIARVVGIKLMNSSHVQRAINRSHYSTSNHFEIYGLDIIMDEDCNLALTEANTQPGLDKTDPIMSNGVHNPEIVKANDITEGIINDSLTLMGIDGKRKFHSPFIRLHNID